MRGTLRTIRKNTVSNPLFVAYLALFLAITGGTAAYAVATIGSPEVVNNSLRSIDLKDGAAVSGTDVVDDSLSGSDLDEGTLAKVPDADKLDGINSSAFARRALSLDFFAQPCVHATDAGCTATFTLQDGVVWTVRCDLDGLGGGFPELTVTATSATGVRSNVTATAFREDVSRYDPQAFSIQGDGTAYSLPASPWNAVGIAVLSSSDRQQVTVNFHASVAPSTPEGTVGCTFEGTAITA